MLHVTCTQRNPGDSWLLMVGSQIGNLTPALSFGHNLYFRCPNESWKPILDIYVLRAFQWYKEVLNPLGFDPCNCSLKIQKSTKTPTPKVGALLGVWGFIPSHFPSLLGLPLGLQPCKPKARVTTFHLIIACFILFGTNHGRYWGKHRFCIGAIWFLRKTCYP